MSNYKKKILKEIKSTFKRKDVGIGVLYCISEHEQVQDLANRICNLKEDHLLKIPKSKFLIEEITEDSHSQPIIEVIQEALKFYADKCKSEDEERNEDVPPDNWTVDQHGLIAYYLYKKLSETKLKN